MYVTKLLQLSIYYLKSDKLLFAALCKHYIAMRGKYWSSISFRTLNHVKFVKFKVYKSELVDIRERDSMPPPE
jgi:hypothetical protein